MEKRADLHVHTYYSDGTFSPLEAVKEASGADIAAIAISDHDCTDGIAESLEAGKRYGVEVIPAVELTAESNGVEVHILGYFIDIDAPPLIGLLEQLKKSRIERIYAMTEKLRRYNIDISPEDVFVLSQKGSVGRMHLASALYNNKKVSSVREAFTKYLADDAPCYVARFNATPDYVIRTILSSGGVPVYAHPGTMGRDDLITIFMRSGLRGIEAYHADHSKGTARRYSELAMKYGLLATGGSDCHGELKGKIGSASVPYSVVEELKRESMEIRNSKH